MNFPGKKVIIFDLDGTVSPSKQPPDKEMSELLGKLSDKYMVAVVSGGSFEQFQKQLLSSLRLNPVQKARFFLLPTSGAALYLWNGRDYETVYQEKISGNDFARIKSELESAIYELSLAPEKTFGEIIEYRGSQVTFSALGQLAPAEVKHLWDPDQKKRLLIRERLLKTLPDFEINIGGMTSIDITRKGIDKAFGIRKLSEHLKVPISEMLYVGDALYSGGNDAVVLQTGITAVHIKDIEETKKIISALLEQ